MSSSPPTPAPTSGDVEAPGRPPGFRLLAVHAHPDDESSKGAATMAKYVREGDEVMVVSCTGGERGDILNPRLADDPHILRDIVQYRRDEMAAAAAILGIQHTWLGFVDSGLPEGDPLPPLPEGCFALEPLSVTTEALVRVIREFKPHVVTTYDERGGYPHPDHVNTHVVSMSAFEAAGDPAAFPSAGEPWQPLKIYYMQTMSRSRTQAIHDEMLARGLESPYGEWLANWKRPDRHVTTRVRCGEYYPLREQALLAHATQVDPDGGWFHVPMTLQQEMWPTEDYELALSYLPLELPEDDLFHGLGSVQEADALARKTGLEIAYDGRTLITDEPAAEPTVEPSTEPTAEPSAGSEDD